MIDPRVLQQHFRQICKNEPPKQPSTPRVSSIQPLTTIQTIFVPPVSLPIIDTPDLQEELANETQTLTVFKQPLTQNFQIEPITITVPVSTAVTKIEEIKLKEDKEEEYDPYGYYSGPKF